MLGGGIVHFFKRYTENSDNQEKTLPVVAQSIQTIAECMESMKKNIQELYESRRQHDIEIAKINVLHEVKKCIKGAGNDVS